MPEDKRHAVPYGKSSNDLKKTNKKMNVSVAHHSRIQPNNRVSCHLHIVVNKTILAIIRAANFELVFMVITSG